MPSLFTNVVANTTSTRALRSLQANPACRLLFVNMVGIVIPRIAIDSSRNKYAGQETAFYELYSTATNYAMPGLLGLGTAYALGKIHNPLGLKTTGWVGNEYLDALSDVYQRSVKPGQPQETMRHFVRETLQQLHVTEPGQKEMARLSPQQVEEQTRQITQLVQQKKPDSKSIKAIAKSMAEQLGSFDRMRWQGRPELSIHPEKLIEHLHQLGREFEKGHQSANRATITEQVLGIAKKLKFVNNAKSVVSLTLVAALGFAAQFINKWITQYRTGNTGFVGYSDFAKRLAHKKPKTDSPILSSIPQATWPQNVRAANSAGNAMPGQPTFGGLVSSQFMPTAEQLKYFIYPTGIVGKLLASRCLDEFRETAIKAGFAYINFLLIPNLVENLVAHSMRNKHVFSQLPEPSPEQLQRWSGKMQARWQKFNQAKVRSYQDIEVYAKKMGEKLGGLDENQIRTELASLLRKVDPVMQGMGQLSTLGKTQRITEAVTKELNRVKNVAGLSAILYSCLTLGFGLNWLNIYITNRRRAKFEAEFTQSPIVINKPNPINLSPSGTILPSNLMAAASPLTGLIMSPIVAPSLPLWQKQNPFSATLPEPVTALYPSYNPASGLYTAQDAKKV